MQQLSSSMTPFSHLYVPQLLLVKEIVEANGHAFHFVHRYLMRITTSTRVLHVKCNPIDQEYFLFEKNQPMVLLSSFSALEHWATHDL